MKNTKQDNHNTFPTETIKIEGLTEVLPELLSNNDTLPIACQEGTKKIPVHRLKNLTKKLSIKASDITGNIRIITSEEVVLSDIIILDGLNSTLEQDITISLPENSVQEGKKLLFINKSPSQSASGFVLKQGEKSLLRLKLPQHKEELLFIEGEWQIFNIRSTMGLIGMDISMVGSSPSILAQKDFLLPYDGKTYSMLDYPELCEIKKYAPDWKFNQETLQFTMPNYTNYFLRHGAPTLQGQKKVDTMRAIKGFSPFITKGKNLWGAFLNASSWPTNIKAEGYVDNWGTDITFDSTYGIAGQEGKKSPNISNETAPQHIITTFYVIAK